MRRAGWIGLIAVVLVAGACAFYVDHMVHHGFSTRTPPSNLEAGMAMTMRDMAIPARYKTLKNPVTSTSEVIHAGEAHYADHCAVCHANNGGGQTMFGETMYPRPPNLAGEDTQSMSDGELYYTIQNGVRLSGMPAFGDARDDDQDSWKLVTFLRHLPKLTQAEETEMEYLNPKGPDEYQEEKEEQQFLDSGDSSAKISTPHQMKEHKQ